MMLLLVAAIPAMADQVNVYENQKLLKSVVFKIGTPYYVVNGQKPGVKMDVAPFIENDRTFVPVRFLGNALGVDN
ncbi:MAG: copper amine oxidase N-terminal domain-containing protein, partial [Peptococcaceae bacterium]|nr:copper amine oxidase N-terminal domain-containing protein [Peptococcaceae bacterium]